MVNPMTVSDKEGFIALSDILGYKNLLKSTSPEVVVVQLHLTLGRIMKDWTHSFGNSGVDSPAAKLGEKFEVDPYSSANSFRTHRIEMARREEPNGNHSAKAGARVGRVLV